MLILDILKIFILGSRGQGIVNINHALKAMIIYVLVRAIYVKVAG